MDLKKSGGKAAFADTSISLPKNLVGHSFEGFCFGNIPKVDQVVPDVARLSIDTPQDNGWAVFSKKNKNQGETSSPKQRGTRINEELCEMVCDREIVWPPMIMVRYHETETGLTKGYQKLPDSRIKYLGTMLFLHNSEKALKWLLIFTRAIRSFVSILTQPMAGPLVDCLDIFLPLWTTFTQGVEAFCSVVLITIESPCSLIQNLVQILFLPLWFILSVIWSTASSIVYPVFLALYELLYAPVRLVLPLARFISSICSYTFELLGEIWLSVSRLLQLVSASEATVSTYEVSMWRTLWNDLFSQVFRAVRSIINGFVAFFAACNRHRLSIYNHIQAYLRRFSCQSNRRLLDSSDSRWKYREVHSPNFSIQVLTENRHTELVFRWHNPPGTRRGKRYLDGKLRLLPFEFPSSHKHMRNQQYQR